MNLMNATNVKVVRRVDRDGNPEPFELMFKRFRKAYQESGVLADVRKHEFALGPSEKRRIKSKEAERTRLREQRKLERFEVNVSDK